MTMEQLVFYGFAGVLIASALMVIVARNPVKSALFLVLAFFASAGLWLLAEAEFLALVLVLVYVGAVMTLFLFVLMMLNLQKVDLKTSFVRFLPIGVAVVAMMVGMLIYAYGPEHLALSQWNPILRHGHQYSNVAELGRVLYTDYVYPFELAAVLLLIAIVAGISLAFRGVQRDAKRQVIGDQVRVDARTRVKLVAMISEQQQPTLLPGQATESDEVS
jgi:NADH-quinone oxidoreductase subunit J